MTGDTSRPTARRCTCIKCGPTPASRSGVAHGQVHWCRRPIRPVAAKTGSPARSGVASTHGVGLVLQGRGSWHVPRLDRPTCPSCPAPSSGGPSAESESAGQTHMGIAVTVRPHLLPVRLVPASILLFPFDQFRKATKSNRHGRKPSRAIPPAPPDYSLPGAPVSGADSVPATSCIWD